MFVTALRSDTVFSLNEQYLHKSGPHAPSFSSPDGRLGHSSRIRQVREKPDIRCINRHQDQDHPNGVLGSAPCLPPRWSTDAASTYHDVHTIAPGAHLARERLEALDADSPRQEDRVLRPVTGRPAVVAQIRVVLVVVNAVGAGPCKSMLV